MDFHLYGLFILTGVSMAYSPGPSVLYTVVATWHHGKRNMLSRIMGQIASLIFFGLVSFLGIGFLTVRFPNFIPAIAILGSIYLFYVGFGQFSLNRKKDDKLFFDNDVFQNHSRQSIFQGLREGFLIGLSNPKIMLVYLIIIPQFISDEFNVPLQMAIIVASQWLIKSSSLFFYVQLADTLKQFVKQPRKQRVLVNFFSIILMAIAAFIFLKTIWKLFE